MRRLGSVGSLGREGGKIFFHLPTPPTSPMSNTLYPLPNTQSKIIRLSVAKI